MVTDSTFNFIYSSSEYVVVTHCSFNLYFTEMTKAFFHMLLVICLSSVKCPNHLPVFLKTMFFVSFLSSFQIFAYFGYKPFVRNMFYKLFSHICGLVLFIFLSIFSKNESVILIKLIYQFPSLEFCEVLKIFVKLNFIWILSCFLLGVYNVIFRSMINFELIFIYGVS